MTQFCRSSRQLIRTLLVWSMGLKVPQNKLSIGSNRDNSLVHPVHGNASNGGSRMACRLQLVGQDLFSPCPLHSVVVLLVNIGSAIAYFHFLFQFLECPSNIPRILCVRFALLTISIDRITSSSITALYVVLVDGTTPCAHQGKVTACRHCDTRRLGARRRGFLHGAYVPMVLTKNRTRLRPTSRTPHIGKRMVLMNGHHISPIATSGLTSYHCLYGRQE
mmetsp:Transcript_77705/g.116866  ORF Transcript_77705/g.116866 Transcript_77705/m.116866 type:complete len:220 (+) Transcript_77705:386-1045(+)